VFGKGARLPGSIINGETESSLASADRMDAQGIAFRRSLALREREREREREPEFHSIKLTMT
jgi:hypothetical protein